MEWIADDKSKAARRGRALVAHWRQSGLSGAAAPFHAECQFLSGSTEPPPAATADAELIILLEMCAVFYRLEHSF